MLLLMDTFELMYCHPASLDINWGSTTQAFLYSYSMRNILKLEKLEDHVKNFRFVVKAECYFPFGVYYKCC